MQSTTELKQKILALEKERSQLTVEVDLLRKAAESRAAALEGEVGQMRETARSLRELVAESSKGAAQTSPNVQYSTGKR
jgi:hypothetical protein